MLIPDVTPQKSVQEKCMFKVDKLDELDYLSQESLDGSEKFFLSFYEFLAMLEGKIRKSPLF